MLVAVRKPSVEFDITGDVPEHLLLWLIKEYGADNVKVERDDLVNAMEMEWFRNLDGEDTPGKNMRFYRKLAGMSQMMLAEKLSVTKQFVSDMENERKPISKEAARKLAGLFNVSVARFI